MSETLDSPLEMSATAGPVVAHDGSQCDDKRERLLTSVDNLEKRVELLRSHALSLEKEKDDLLCTLHNLQFDPELHVISEGAREDIMVNSERLICRCLTVEVDVITPRDAQQEAALRTVQSFINTLEIQIKSHLEESHRNLTLFLNACLDTDGAVHQDFQKALLSCTADDQKKVRTKLQLWDTSLKQSKGRFQML